MKSKETYDIQFQPIGKRVKVAPGTSILEAAIEGGIDLASACGGEGDCGQCQVVTLEGDCSPITSNEEFILTELERLNDKRLACCTRAQSDLIIHIPKGSLITGQRLQIASQLEDIEPDPIVTAYTLELTRPTLEDPRSDLTRILDELRDKYSLGGLHASPETLRSAPDLLRDNDWHVSALVREDEIIGLCPPNGHQLGFAVDLGTTKIAAFLMDLNTGEELGSLGAPNPQIGYGEDVISRLNHVHRNQEGGRLLAKKVHQSLDELLAELLFQAGAQREEVVEACIVGNTAMIHLLLELPVRQLAKAPYVAAASTALDIRAGGLGLAINPGSYVHIPPCIGGFVGADHVAMILASDLDQAEKVILGVDIGTNTEIALCKPGLHSLTSASCASGPAFEGAHISDGMRAASGAIEKLRITESGVEIVTIDNEPAVGLCGSGMIDTVAELYRTGFINQRGRFQRQLERVRAGRRGAEFMIVPASKSGAGGDIVIDQNDINEIQLAKGAIQAGINILLEATGTQHSEVEEVVVAGAFGSFLNIENAIAMGLFPDMPNARYRQIGNAAAIGAKWMLTSALARLRAQKIAEGTEYNELTTYPKFRRQFALGMLFPEAI